MKNSKLFFAMILVILVACSVITSSTFAGDDGDVPAGFEAHQAIVQLSAGVDIDEINEEFDTTVILSIPSRRLYLLQFDERIDEEQFAEMLEEDRGIIWADLNFENAVPGGSTQSFFFNVPPSQYSSQYVWGRVNLAPTASPPGHLGAGPLVALLDTGLDVTHPALAGITVRRGFNFIDNNSNIADIANGIDDDQDGHFDELVGHGTFMAGIVAHIAPNASLLPVRVLNSDGSSNSFHVAQGIYFAIDQGAKIINLSLGTTNNSELVAIAIQEARNAGILVLASAGNANLSAPMVYPAADPNVIGVAGTDQGDFKAGFSNYGSHIDLCAPGVDVVSLLPNGQYARCNGTSAATAFVSGAAARLKCTSSTATVDELRAWLTGSADNIDNVNPAYVGLLGAGRLNIDAATSQIPLVAGDINADYEVDVDDLLAVINAWGPCPPPPTACYADLTGNGLVNVDDLLIVINNWS